MKPNGTLVLQARKQIKTDDEEQFFILTGICRAEDVSADNTILSTQLSTSTSRRRTRATSATPPRRGWLPKLLDVINPF